MRNCRSCGGSLELVYDLGLHYLPDFTEPGTDRGSPQPLTLVTCMKCTLLQLADTTPRTDLYHERYGFKSGVNEAVRADLASVVQWALDRAGPVPRRWLDIACNDGTLLSNVPRAFYRAGIDPLEQFAGEADEFSDVVISDYFQPEYFQASEFDVVTSVSVFYDLDDPNQFVADVARTLAPDGVWVIQQNYALDMLRQNAIDNVCHEHVTYFSVTSLQYLLAPHGLEVSDVTWSPVNGGCIRTLVNFTGKRPVTSEVARFMQAETRLSMPPVLRLWAGEVLQELYRTYREVEGTAGETYVYGASTRGGTILQLLGMGPELLPYAVERQPAKVGKVMAATGIPIISEEQMRANPPAALLVSPWFFRDVFVEREAAYLRAGGKMLFPLPAFEAVTQ